MSETKTELRSFADELRVVEDQGQPPKIVGLAAVYNSLSEDLGGFREKILPGAFADVVAGNDEVLALMHHDPRFILGRRSRGTLLLREEPHGLAVEIVPPNTTVGKDAVENVRRGDIKGMSFRFSRPTDSWQRVDGERIRTITKIGKLFEVTLTPVPAYEATTAEVRAAIAALDESAAARPNLQRLALRIRMTR